MSDLAHHQTEAVQLIFLGMGKSAIIHTDHNCMDNIIVSKYTVYMQFMQCFITNSKTK